MNKEKSIEAIASVLGSYLIPEGMRDEVILEAIKAYEDAQWNVFDPSNKHTWPPVSEDNKCIKVAVMNTIMPEEVFVLNAEYVKYKDSYQIAIGGECNPEIITHWRKIPEPLIKE